MKDFKKNIKDYLEFKEISFKLFLKIFLSMGFQNIILG